MIPKIIHYCWISGEENMPEDIKQCISSWHKYLPDYQFINWNDSNFDWSICDFTKHCRENNLYAFCSDYVRFWALYNYGGIYLDSDVIVYKSFNDLLKFNYILSNECETKCKWRIETAIMGSEKHNLLFKKILDFYNKINIQSENIWVGICPDIIYSIIEFENYQINKINSIDNYKYDNKILNLLDEKKFFGTKKELSKDIYALHLFKNSWTLSSKLNLLNINQIKQKIFNILYK